MRVTLRLFAGLRERAGRDTLVLEDVPDGLDVGGLKRFVAERYPELGPLEGVRGVVEQQWVEDTRPLEPGVEVALLPPVSGGSGEEEGLIRGVFELRSEPLDPGEAWRRVAHPRCGGACVFVGSTRSTNRGQDVVRLEYEAWQAMARSQMKELFGECLERFGPPSRGGDPAFELRMLVWHRTGTVGVGEPSVVVAVASPHRDAAFRAARFLIDQLKARVPLWKREVYVKGHHWIGERS